jgi:hypothetical protein
MVKQWQRLVVLAYTKGYRVHPDGTFTNPTGKRLRRTSRSAEYPSFGFWWRQKVRSIPLHKFAAFCFFNEEALTAPCVRHRNGDTYDLRRDNVCLGTYSENEQDKTPATRHWAAKVAAAHTRHVRDMYRVSASGNKKCRRCLKNKDASMFPLRSDKKELRAWCKPCYAANEKERRRVLSKNS